VERDKCPLVILAIVALLAGMQSLDATEVAAQVPEPVANSVADPGVPEMVALGPSIPTHPTAARTDSPCERRYNGGWKVKICRPGTGPQSSAVGATIVAPTATSTSPAIAPTGATAGLPSIPTTPVVEMGNTDPLVVAVPAASAERPPPIMVVTSPPVMATPVVVTGTDPSSATPVTAQLEGDLKAVHEQLESLQSAVRILETTPRSVTVIEQERASWLRWGFGASGVSTGTTDSAGPNAYLAEVYFRGELGFASGWFCTLQAGGGTGSLDGAGDGGSPVAISNFVGIVNYTLLGEDYPLALGGRQRVTFVREGNRLNAVMGELQFSANLLGPLSVTVTGGLGSSWFIYEAKPTFVVPGLKMENELKQGSGLTYELALGLYLRLF